MGERAADIQVIGGGFAGLSVAYFLAKRGKKVRIVESGPRVGGLLNTVETKYGLAETAANALLSNALVERTAAELGIELVPAQASSRRRYIFRRGKPRRFPLAAAASARFFGETVPRFFFARRSFAPRPRETIRAWGERCLGAEATEYLLIPGLGGIYAGDPDHLSASLILGRFFGTAKGARVARGKLRGSVAPREGMGAFPLAFRRALEESGTQFSDYAEEGLATIVALPPPRAAEFLHERAPLLAAQLKAIEMVSIASATVFLPAQTKGIEGFGCLFPRAEGYRVLGILANDRIFPNRVKPGFRSETWIFGGATDASILEKSPDEIRALILAERTRLFGEAPVVHAEVNRWPAAIPHYSITLEDALQRLREINFRENNFTLFGTYLGDLGLARVLARAEALSQEYP